MTDRVEQFLRSNTGGAIAAKLGLVVPELKRYRDGTGLPEGTVVLAGRAGETASATLRAQLDALGIKRVDIEGADVSAHFPEGNSDKCAALIYDGRGAREAADLADLQRFFRPMLRRLANDGRILVIAEPHELADSPEQAAAQRALEGFTRSLAKEIGNRGSTAQLLLIEPGADGSGSRRRHGAGNR
jgi:3-oxoacyl-[acyl-carrier protein] reductase